MTNEIDFDQLTKELFEKGIPDPREAILKDGHWVNYGDDINLDIEYIEYPDLERYTIPVSYIPTISEFKNREFSQLIKKETLTEPCYITDI